MSKIQTRREIADDLASAKAEVEAIRIERDESIEASRVELETDSADFHAKLDELNAKVDKQIGQICEFETRAEKAEKDLADVTAKADEAAAELVATKAELDKAKATLANPAVADAQLADAKAEDLPKAQADAEADALEAAAMEAAKADAPKDIVEEYEAMAQGPERIAFWNKNKRAIMAIYDGAEKQED